MSNKFHDVLSRDFSRLLDEGRGCDVLISVGEEPHMKEFSAHSLVLQARSPYFQSALSHSWVKKDGHTILFRKPNILPEIFNIILRYIYSGSVMLEDQGAAAVFDVLRAADELIIPDVQEFAEDHLIRCESEWLQNNFSVLHRIAFQHRNFSKLQNYYLDTICKDPKKLFAAEDFCSVDVELLVLLLQRNDLNMEEIDVWDYLIQWALAQDPTITADIVNWTAEEFNVLESLLHDCIPHLRFCDINPRDFYLKVMPFKKIIPIEMYKEIERHFYKVISKSSSMLITPREKSVSTIMSDSHVTEISSWINGGEVASPSSSSSSEQPQPLYDFRLLMRGGCDGFTANAFHERCDDMGATVVLIRVAGSGQIIGGYNPISWGSDNTWTHTKDSFIFSLTHGESGQSTLSRVRTKQASHAIYNSDIFGPCFGRGDLCMNKTFSEHGSFAKMNDYERRILVTQIGSPNGTNGTNDHNTKFSVSEYEVFAITRRKRK